MKSIALHDYDHLGGAGSILSRQKRDHIRLDALLRQLDEAGADGQGPVLLDVWRLVFPHAFAEESVLWPVMRRVLPDGEALTLRVEREHQEINELVGRLEALEPDTKAYRHLLKRIVELLVTDVRDEEDMLLPRLQSRLTPTQLRVVGVAWAVVRRVAPTRAHPIVSRRPPGNVLAALPLSLVDRLRDAVDAILYHGVGPIAPPLHLLGRALGGVAHAVEHLPGLRLGERPETRVARSGSRWGVLAVAAGAVAMTFAMVRPKGREARLG